MPRENRNDPTTSARSRQQLRFLLERALDSFSALFESCKTELKLHYEEKRYLGASAFEKNHTGLIYSQKKIEILKKELRKLDLEEKLEENPKSVTPAEREELARLDVEIDEWNTGEGLRFDKWYAQEEPGQARTKKNKTNKSALQPVRLQGTARQFAEWVRDGFSSGVFAAEDEWDAFKNICPHFIQKDGKRLTVRNVWQNLQNKKTEGK